MPRLIWDYAGERRYETGIDRGVLYHPDGYAVQWDGLVSVTDAVSRDVTPYHHDGIVIYNSVKRESYAGTLRCITYPDELNYLMGVEDHVGGVSIYDQRFRTFSLAYRTLEGDDQHGDPPHYKIHIVYNVTAVPADHQYTTLDDSPDLEPFEFSLSAVPYPPGGSGNPTAPYRPISHISISSRLITSDRLTALENALYGDPNGDPEDPSAWAHLLSPTELLTLVDSM